MRRAEKIDILKLGSRKKVTGGLFASLPVFVTTVSSQATHTQGGFYLILYVNSSFNQFEAMFFKFISVDYHSNLMKSEVELPCCNYLERVFPSNLRR